MVTLSHLKVMESTILLLVSQLTAGILFDALMFHNISARKISGIVLIAAGIIWDNKFPTLRSSGPADIFCPAFTISRLLRGQNNAPDLFVIPGKAQHIP